MSLFERIDVQVTGWMARHGVRWLRLSLGVVFLWFGGLKLVPGMSPAADLAGRTVFVMSGGWMAPAVSVPLLGAWEVLIGLGLVSGRALRTTIFLLLVQMPGTLMPLLLFPEEVFAHPPFGLTMVGQYIVKNVVLVSAALVVGATVRDRIRKTPPAEQ